MHRAVIADLIDANSSIFTDFAIDAIKEAVIEPLSGFRNTRVILCASLQGAPLPFHLLYECSYKKSNIFDRASQIFG